MILLLRSYNSHKAIASQLKRTLAYLLYDRRTLWFKKDEVEAKCGWNHVGLNWERAYLGLAFTTVPYYLKSCDDSDDASFG